MAIKKTDIVLLQQNPSELLMRYQPLLQKLLQHYVTHSNFVPLPPMELRDYLQSHLPAFLQRLFKKHGIKTRTKTLIAEAVRLLCNNFEDLQLLKQSSPQLAVKYTSIIIARVRSYVNTQNLKETDAEDVVQTVQEKLIIKVRDGKLAGFGGDSMVRTFLFRVIENLIRDVLKSMRTQKARVSSSGTEIKEHHAIEGSTFQALAGKMDLEQQAQTFKYLLKLYKDKDRQKFEISSKVNYQIVLGNRDLQSLNLSDDDKVELLVVFGKDFNHLSTSQLWNHLVVFVNQLEGKRNSADALWKWFVRHRNWMTVKILFVQHYDGGLQKKLTDAEKALLTKISARSFSKFVDEYFGEVVYAYYVG